MAITVGTDTYISLADANTYVSNNYPTTATEYTTWNNLTDANKELYLKKATKKIDRLLLRGVKAVSTQTLEFPRAIRTDYRRENFPLVNIRLDADWVVETAVSQQVKDAQVEEALQTVTQGATATKRQQLQAQGVKSFSLGNLSESYGSGGGSSANTSTKLISVDAQELLRYYVLGAVSIG
jgi:hypothetical protein